MAPAESDYNVTHPSSAHGAPALHVYLMYECIRGAVRCAAMRDGSILAAGNSINSSSSRHAPNEPPQRALAVRWAPLVCVLNLFGIEASLSGRCLIIAKWLIRKERNEHTIRQVKRSFAAEKPPTKRTSAKRYFSGVQFKCYKLL